MEKRRSQSLSYTTDYSGQKDTPSRDPQEKLGAPLPDGRGSDYVGCRVIYTRNSADNSSSKPLMEPEARQPMPTIEPAPFFLHRGYFLSYYNKKEGLG